MKKRILICDDDPDILEISRRILERKQYEVETSTDCESVLPKIERINPEIILMDLWIPVMGGEAAVNFLKNNDATKHIPVILFSANNDIETIASRVSADGYLKKPFDIRELQQVVEQHIL